MVADAQSKHESSCQLVWKLQHNTTQQQSLRVTLDNHISDSSSTCLAAHNMSITGSQGQPSSPCCVVFHKYQYLDQCCFSPTPSSWLLWLRKSRLSPHLYADDTRVWFLHTQLCRLIKCINAAAGWMRSNRLQLNTSKTEVLWCTMGRQQHQPPCYTVSK